MCYRRIININALMFYKKKHKIKYKLVLKLLDKEVILVIFVKKKNKE